MSIKHPTIAFIGAGNMANALLKGLIANEFPPRQLWATDPDQEKLSSLQDLGVNTSTDNIEALQQSDVVILAVKPQLMQTVLEPLQGVLRQHACLLISIAAGIPLQTLQQWTHTGQALVRCMPNTPALVQSGASALFANQLCSAEQKALAEILLSAVGTVNWLEQESDMNAVTALSGSGPAYFFLLMEAMQEAGIDLGLTPETARDLCVQTALGAAKLAISSDDDVATLRRKVTSPGGTTEAALKQFEEDNFKAIVSRALGKAADRSDELAKHLSNK